MNGSGGKVAHFLVAIAHGHGIILAEQYEGRLNGQQFADFVHDKFPGLFEKSCNPRGKLFCKMATLHKTVERHWMQFLMLEQENFQFLLEVRI